jgi:hypothetical protein
MITLACTLFSVGCVAHDTPGPHALVTDQFYDLLRWNGTAFHDNCWQADLLSDPNSVSSLIWYDQFSDTVGWRWSWPPEAVAELKGYPCLIVGEQPFLLAEPTTDRRFPLPVCDIETLWVRGDVTASGTGVFELAFDLFFLDTRVPVPADTSCEIMIWLVSTHECAATRHGEYQIDHHTYDLHVNTTWHDAPYLAFVLRDNSPPRRLPLHEFIRIGAEEGFVDPDFYLAGPLLGPEIWWGEGEATIRNFRFSLNGRQ